MHTFVDRYSGGVARPKSDSGGGLIEVFFGRLVRLLRGIMFLAMLTKLSTRVELMHLRDISPPEQIAEGTARRLVQTFDVKKRKYFGNTSMEAEISLLMANQTLVRYSLSHLVACPRTESHSPQASPGKLVYDPFIGTGSMAYVSLGTCSSIQIRLILTVGPPLPPETDHSPLRRVCIWLGYRWSANARQGEGPGNPPGRESVRCGEADSRPVHVRCHK